MIIHNSPLFQIFFGDQRTHCIPDEFRGSANLIAHEPFATIADELDLQSLLILRQVHGVDGYKVDPQQVQTMHSFAKEGDYMITTIRHVGLGVVTGDCVPLILYDKVHHALGIVHAGWRGLVNGVIGRCVEHMQRAYKTDPARLKVFIGSCAKSCCYIVGDEVLSALDSSLYKDRVICDTQHGSHFDMPLCAQLQLRELGVKPDAFELSYNECTMCSEGLCSARKYSSPHRNVTVAVLK